MITVTATDKAADPSAPPAPRKDWRFYAGMTAMALAVIMPLCALVVPVLGLSTTQSALLAGILLAGGPEVLCILAVALLGKETFLYFAHRAKTALRRAVIDQPASKARYYTGLVVILRELASSLYLRLCPRADAARRCAHLPSRRDGSVVRRERLSDGRGILGKGQAHLRLRRQDSSHSV